VCSPWGSDRCQNAAVKLRLLALAIPLVAGLSACSSDASSPVATAASNESSAPSVTGSAITSVAGPTTAAAAFDPDRSARQLLGLYQKGTGIKLTTAQIECVVALVNKTLTNDEVQAALAGDTSALNIDFNSAFASCGMKVSTT
jgi:hypothetical protein